MLPRSNSESGWAPPYYLSHRDQRDNQNRDWKEAGWPPLEDGEMRGVHPPQPTSSDPTGSILADLASAPAATGLASIAQERGP